MIVLIMVLLVGNDFVVIRVILVLGLGWVSCCVVFGDSLVIDCRKWLWIFFGLNRLKVVCRGVLFFGWIGWINSLCLLGVLKVLC